MFLWRKIFFGGIPISFCAVMYCTFKAILLEAAHPSIPQIKSSNEISVLLRKNMVLLQWNTRNMRLIVWETAEVLKDINIVEDSAQKFEE